MLNPSAIFKKTDAGVTEVSSRALGLRAAARRVLIMADGRNSVATLSATVRAEEIEGIIGELQALALIETVGGVVAGGDLRSLPIVEVSAPLAEPSVQAVAESGELSTVEFPLETSAAVDAPVVQLDAPINDEAAYVAEPTIAQFVGARQAAVRSLKDILGLRAEIFASRIEKCKTANELREQVILIRQSLTNLVDESAATRFVEAVREGAKV
jgi:hypothetical protein